MRNILDRIYFGKNLMKERKVLSNTVRGWCFNGRLLIQKINTRFYSHMLNEAQFENNFIINPLFKT